jgi:hypothetical protein
MDTDDQLSLTGCYDIASFCKTYRVSRSTAYVELAAGRLKGRKNGRRLLILKEDAATWARSLPAAEFHRAA